ncbi:MAG: hypothetical protein MSH40_06640 [Christensenella sp.]|nr:hypothetical protein [Christensenella sp.]
MKVKNVASILFTKFNLVFKMIIFLLILSFVLAIISSAFFLPVLNGLRNDIEELNLVDNASDYIKSLLKGEDTSESYDALVDSIKKVPAISDKWDINIIFSVVFLLLIIFIFAVFYYMAYYTVGDILYSFMSSNSKFGFTSNYIYNMKKSFRFALIYAAIVIAYYFIMFSLTFIIALLFGKVSAYLGLFVFFLLAYGVLALRRALFVYWIPYLVIEGCTPIEALKNNFNHLKGNFLKFFAEYYVVYLCFVMTSFLVSIFTAGVGIIINYAISWLVMQIMDNVEFYNLKGKKYYIDEQTVVDPKLKYRDAVIEDDNFSL